MTTLTDKELIKEIKERIGSLDIRDNIERRTYEISLASLEAKPIGAFHIAEQQVDGTSDYIKDGEWPIDNGIIEVYAAPPASVVPEGLVKAVRFYEQVKRENPPVETVAWKDAVDWVLEEACLAVKASSGQNA
ncbi:hypothetical protein HHK34_002791 [Escherichia coli]|nr:hypothetical protein [Escherichia coli]